MNTKGIADFTHLQRKSTSQGMSSLMNTYFHTLMPLHCFLHHRNPNHSLVIMNSLIQRKKMQYSMENDCSQATNIQLGHRTCWTMPSRLLCSCQIVPPLLLLMLVSLVYQPKGQIKDQPINRCNCTCNMGCLPCSIGPLIHLNSH